MPRLLSPRFVFAWFASLFQGLAFFLFVHFPGYLEDLGAGKVEIGLIVGITGVAALLIRPWVGKQMDRRGRRPVILWGNAVNVVVLLLYLTVDSLGPWVYVVRFLHGIAEAMLFAAMFTYAADLVPVARRTEGLALFGVSGLLPIALGGIIGDFVLHNYDFHALFWTSLLLAIVGFLFALPLAETFFPEPGHVASFLAPLRKRDLLPLWWVTLVFSFALTAYFTFLRTFVDETGIGTVGAFFSAYATVAIAERVFAGWLPDRVGAKKVLYPALAVFATGFVVLALAESTAAVVVAGALCGGGHGYGFPILYSLVFSRATEGNTGSASAIFTGLFDLGAVTGGPILGQLISSFGYQTMFLAAAGWVVAGSLIFARWDGDLGSRRSPPAPPR